MLARLVLGVAIALLATGPRATAGEPCDPDCRIAKVRALLEHGDRLAARDELLALHAETARPDLLFALGQVELALGHHEAAIAYYERFIATGPGDDQVALAQQAIGAARLRMVEPPPPPPPPQQPARIADPAPPPPFRRYERRWDRADTIVAVLGGAAIAAGAGLLYHAHRLGNDTGGTLAEYDDRLEHAEARRLAGFAIAAAGVIGAGIAIVRWRLDETEVIVRPAAVVVVRRW